jgi:hypothetical protein
VRKRNDFKTHCARNWPSSGSIWRRQWLRWVGDAWIFPPPTLLAPIFWSDFRWRSRLCPSPFSECNENIFCFALIGIIKMLAGVECGHLPELKKLALSCNDSLLHDVRDDVG